MSHNVSKIVFLLLFTYLIDLNNGCACNYKYRKSAYDQSSEDKAGPAADDYVTADTETVGEQPKYDVIQPTEPYDDSALYVYAEANI